jgi:hypothetical protein
MRLQAPPANPQPEVNAEIQALEKARDSMEQVSWISLQFNSHPSLNKTSNSTRQHERRGMCAGEGS